MHYTGMSALHVHVDPAAADPAGGEVFTFLFPVFVVGAIALAVSISATLMAESRLERSVPV
jgi:NO-binding membrane sensor protein with MHYT domain